MIKEYRKKITIKAEQFDGADDNAIIKLEAEKFYSDQPRVEIIMEVEDDDE